MEKHPSPIAIQIVDIELRKRDGQSVSLMPQFLEFCLYQSVFQPMMRAELRLIDPIGLFYNFPMIGEETIKIKYRPTRAAPGSGDEARANAQVLEMEFMVNSAEGIAPDDKAKQQTYILELYSIEMLVNAKTKVQRAFNENYSSSAKKVLKEDLGAAPTKIKDTLFEPSKGIYHYIVPNLKPLETVAWMAKRAVPEDTKHSFYMFYENFDGYNFRSLEHIIEKGMGGTVPDYYYVSNQDKIAIERLQTPAGGKIQKHQVMTAMQTDKRFHTLEKSIFGYFENEFYDIDVFNKKITSTRTRLQPISDPDLKKYNMNTDGFIKLLQTDTDKPGTGPRTHYKVTIDGGDQPGKPAFWEKKFGPVTKTHTGMSQISITASLPGDTNIQAGSIVRIDIPEVYGFTTVKEDRYLVGHYVVISIKHLITAGERHVMVVELHRANFEKTISNKIEYYVGE